MAALNVASFGTGTDRHWEDERAALLAYKRHQIQTESTTASGHPQTQPGFLSGQLSALDRRYRHLKAGGWRTLSDTLPGIPVFDQWKPREPRQAQGKRAGKVVKYEAPPAFPDGGGAFLPRVPERIWRLICERQDLPFPGEATRAAGFWPWAAATPALRLLLTEGSKKALAALSAGYAAVGLPGVQMGRRVGTDNSEHLIDLLEHLATRQRVWLIGFDAEARLRTAAKVGAAAGALARTLRAAGSRPLIARLPLLPGAEKTGIDDLLAAAGPEALERALADTGPRAVLPRLRPADRIAAAGAWLSDACPIPSPEVAPLVVVEAPMGAGKTQNAAAALAPLAAVGVPVLMPSHRQALGQAAAESLGVPWCPAPGSDERLQGVAGCWDSWCPDSGLQISPTGWSGGVLVADEWQQALEHLLLSTGTALADRRAEVLRTAAEQLARMRQTIAMDAQLADWGVTLLERLSGHRALLIRSDHRPMAGRPLHCPEGFTTPQAAAGGFWLKWAELVDAGRPFLCWSSAQRAGMRNAPQTLAIQHGRLRPDDLIDVIDSSTPELATELAADPDGFAERRTAEAERLGVGWAIYCSPAISSGISFQRWRPAAVIAYAGGQIAPEHAAQALARVRCPEVPAYLFAPERCPGDGLQVLGGSTDPAQLIADLRAAADPLLGVLQDAGDPWLEAWAELGAHRNRQCVAYRATIAGLLEREGWELQAREPEPTDAAAKVLAIGTALKEITKVAQAAEDQAVIEARTLTEVEAQALAKRRKLEPADRNALQRHRLTSRWGLGGAAPSLELLKADRDGLRDRLRLGWLLTTPKALALVPTHDEAATAALDRSGRPFAPDRLRVTISSRIAALQALGVPQLLERFAAGERITATDPAVLALHATATTYRGQLIAAAGCGPGAKATGTLRALLRACGWRLERAGRVKARGVGRDALIYRAHPLALPEGVRAEALAAAWMGELQAPASVRSGGALFALTEKTCREQKCPTLWTPPPSPAPRSRSLAPAAAIPWFTSLSRRPESVLCPT
ncbi:MAG: DUF3854 domain-containing protein [Synechococcus sp.]